MSAPRIIGLMCVRNEAWCLRLSVAAALKYVDHLIVMDHASTDDTPDILTSFQSFHPSVSVIRNDNPDWNEAQYRQILLDRGREMGGTHFIIIDGDEVLTANISPHVELIASTLVPGQAAILPWPCLWRSLHYYRKDASAFGSATCKWMFHDAPDLAYVAPGGYEFHARFPESVERKLVGTHSGGVMHLQHSDWPRLLWKQLWYQMQEVARWGKIRANYACTVNEDAIKLAPVPPEWWGDNENLLLTLPRAGTTDPWQRRDCMKLWRLHGPEKFDKAGVNYFELRYLL